MNRLIYFLVRLKLGVRKNQLFRYCNQKTKALYYINERGVMKLLNGVEELSDVSINYLLSYKCKIRLGG